MMVKTKGWGEKREPQRREEKFGTRPRGSQVVATDEHGGILLRYKVEIG